MLFSLKFKVIVDDLGEIKPTITGASCRMMGILDRMLFFIAYLADS
jgi:hypothetical protein